MIVDRLELEVLVVDAEGKPVEGVPLVVERTDYESVFLRGDHR